MKTLRLTLFALLIAAVFTTGLAAQTNPVPFLYAPPAPSAVAPGGTAFTVGVAGTGFVSGSVVNWNGSPRTTTFVSSSKLTASIMAADIASPGTGTITVTSPTPGGGTSNPVTLQVMNPLQTTVFANNDILSTSDTLSNIVSADFNGDGKQDLAVGDGFTVYVIPGVGDSTFGAPIRSTGPSAGIHQIFVADFNGDGKPDLLLSTSGGTYVELGNGDGTFTLFGSFLTDASASVMIADFNGDGKLDLAYTSPGWTKIQVQFGNGDGTFTPGPATTFTPTNGLTSLDSVLATADFNGDGKLDLLVTATYTPSMNQQSLLLFPGNGDGTFGTYTIVPGTTHDETQSIDALVADFNGDGKPDLAYFVLAGAFGPLGTLSVYLGNGDGTFQTPFQPPLSSTVVPRGPLVAGDFNGDGKLDLVDGNQLFYGNGDGTFTALGGPVSGVSAFLAGDFNGDGKLDLIAFGSAANTDLRILLQVAPPDFTGSITSASQTLVPGGSVNYTVGISPLNGFSGNVTLTASGLPAGVTASFSPNPVTGGSGTSTLTLSSTTSVALGNYSFTITGTSGSITHSSNANLLVNSSPGDFTGSISPNPQTILAGNTATYTITITPISGFTGNVNLSVGGNLPSGSSVSLTPSTIAGGSGTATLKITTSSTTAANVYVFSVTATSGPLTHAGTASLGVTNTSRDFSGTVTPSSQTVAVGGTANYAINITRTSGTGALDVTLSVSGLPVGATATISPSVLLDPTSAATMSIGLPPGTAPGTYTLVITGTAHGIIHQTSVTLVVTP